MGETPISFVAPVAMVSPCVNVCTLNAAGTHCMGCGRTTAEIAGWTRGTPEWRRSVMAELPARMAELDPAASQAGNATPPR